MDTPRSGLKATLQRNPVMTSCAGLLALVVLFKLVPDTGATSDDQGKPAPSIGRPLAASSPAKDNELLRNAVVDGGTRCSAVIQDFDGKNRQRISAVDMYVQDVMREEDGVHVVRDERSVIAGLDADGFAGVRAMAIVYCRQKPSSSLHDAAAEAYDGVRSLQNELGAR